MKALIKVLLVFIGLTVLLYGYLYFVGAPNWAFKYYQEYKAEGYVKLHLNDPESAVFKDKQGPCGEVNSKNKFGGYTGFTKYVASSEKAVTFEDSPIFEKIWEFSCLMTEEQKMAEINKINI